jgi:hypothetical protein
MRFKEFFSSFKPFKVTIKLQHEKFVVTTIFFSDSASNLRKMLVELFGESNVVSVSEIMHESPQTDQIQREAAIRPHLVLRQAQPRKVAQIQPSQVQQLGKRPQKRQVSARPIADPIKHDLVQDRLTKQFMRQSNIVKPTIDDLRIAKSRADTSQKRVDLEFKKQAEAQLRRQERQKHKRQ